MTNYLTFLFNAKTFAELMEQQPDYFLVNAGFNIEKKANGSDGAVLAVNVEAYKNGADVPVLTKAGCPVPPCKPSGSSSGALSAEG
jgi:hypothetical protein